jgi:two-component system, NarL family, nitrate/nitrite response regulator NarL
VTKNLFDFAAGFLHSLIRVSPIATMDARLTPREHQILTFLGVGLTSKEIAIRLNLSPATIASHRKKICSKLGIHSTAGLIRYALSDGRGEYQSRPAPSRQGNDE